jgi:hypothetical protein
MVKRTGAASGVSTSGTAIGGGVSVGAAPSDPTSGASTRPG